MSILMVANCPGCGKVFQKNLRNLCQECVKGLQSEFDACYRYMSANRKATTEQLIAACGVSAQQITRWMKEKRLPVTDFPHLTYPCKSCNGPIKQLDMCHPCMSRLTKEIREMKEKEEARNAHQGFGFRNRISRF